MSEHRKIELLSPADIFEVLKYTIGEVNLLREKVKTLEKLFLEKMEEDLKNG